MSKKIKYVGEESYHGTDPANDNQPINLNPGESTKVSDEKAAQLGEDMGWLFEIDGEPATAKPARNVAPVENEHVPVVDLDPLEGLDPIELLERLKLAQIVEVAAAAGFDEEAAAHLRKPGTSKAAAIAAIAAVKPLDEVVQLDQVAELIKATVTE